MQDGKKNFFEKSEFCIIFANYNTCIVVKNKEYTLINKPSKSNSMKTHTFLLASATLFLLAVIPITTKAQI